MTRREATVELYVTDKRADPDDATVAQVLRTGNAEASGAEKVVARLKAVQARYAVEFWLADERDKIASGSSSA